MAVAIRSQSGDSGVSGETSGGKALAVCRFRGEVLTSLSWAADGRSIAISGFGGPVRVWDLDSGRPRSVEEGVEVAAPGFGSTRSRVASFSPNGRSLAIGTSEGEVAIWDVASLRKMVQLDHGVEAVRSIAWSPNGHGLSWTKGRTIRRYDLDSRRLEILAGRDGPSSRLVYSPDGRLLAGSGVDGTIRIWDLATGRERYSQRTHSCGVQGLAFTGDGDWVITCGISGPTRLWNTATGEERRPVGDDSPSSAVAYSPDGLRLADAARDGTIRIRDLASGRAVVRLTGQSGAVAALAWSPDGRMLASAGYDGAARLWDVSGSP